MHRRPGRSLGRSRGQALVEFALVIPIFLLILAGMIDFGSLLYSRMSVINAARSGAQYGSTTLIGSALGGSPTAIQSRVSSVATGLVSAGDVSVVCLERPGSTVVCSGSAWEAGDAVSVTVTYPYHPRFPLLFGSVMNVTSTVQMVVFDPGEQPTAAVIPPGPTAAPTPTPALVCRVVPDMVGMRVSAARTAWSSAGFTGSFSPSSSSSTDVVTSQSRTAGTCLPASTTITAGHESCRVVPAMVGTTLSSARSAWTAAGFTGAFSPSSGSNSNVVTTQNQVAGDCMVAATTVTVQHEVPCFIVPNLIDMTVSSARSAWTAAGFTGTFTPSSGSNTNVVTSQTRTAGGCLVASTTVTVTHRVPCQNVPDLVGMTVASARSAWTSAGFTGTFTPSSGSSANIVYAQSRAAGSCLVASTSISVSHAQACTGSQRMVPALVGLTVGDGRAAWSAAGFTGSFTPSNGLTAKTVVTQSRTAGSCTNGSSSITVTYQ